MEVYTYNKQRAIQRDWLKRTRGLSSEQIYNNKYLAERAAINHLYNLYFSMGEDNENAKRQIAKLDERLMELDYKERQELLENTHKEVKDVAYKAIDEAVNDFIKDFNKK